VQIVEPLIHCHHVCDKQLLAACFVLVRGEVKSRTEVLMRLGMVDAEGEGLTGGGGQGGHCSIKESVCSSLYARPIPYLSNYVTGLEQAAVVENVSLPAACPTGKLHPEVRNFLLHVLCTCTPYSAGIVTIKGRAACEIDTADELLTAELMFNGTLLGLDIHSLVALVSCLIPVEKSTEHVKLTAQLGPVLVQLQVRQCSQKEEGGGALGCMKGGRNRGMGLLSTGNSLGALAILHATLCGLVAVGLSTLWSLADLPFMHPPQPLLCHMSCTKHQMSLMPVLPVLTITGNRPSHRHHLPGVQAGGGP
jgi:hypothetical protein